MKNANSFAPATLAASVFALALLAPTPAMAWTVSWWEFGTQPNGSCAYYFGGGSWGLFHTDEYLDGLSNQYCAVDNCPLGVGMALSSGYCKLNGGSPFMGWLIVQTNNNDKVPGGFQTLHFDDYQGTFAYPLCSGSSCAHAYVRIFGANGGHNSSTTWTLLTTVTLGNSAQDVSVPTRDLYLIAHSDAGPGWSNPVFLGVN